MILESFILLRKYVLLFLLPLIKCTAWYKLLLEKYSKYLLIYLERISSASIILCQNERNIATKTDGEC